VALGYDSDVFGFTGTDWELSVNREANAAGLYDEIRSIDTSAGLSRDNTAQMAYNALESNVMVVTYGKDTSTGVVSNSYALSEDTTFLNKYFNALTFVGQMDGNSSFLSIAEGSIQVTGNLDTASAGTPDVQAVFPSDLDISNIGEEIKIIFKDGRGGTTNRPDKNDTIYGVFNTGKTQVINATLADIATGSSAPTDTNKIKVDGTTYTVAVPDAGDTLVVTNYGANADTTAATATAAATKAVFEGLQAYQTGDTVKFVCNSDGEINRAYVVNYTMSYVTAVTSTKVTINGLGTITIADHDVYDGIAVDDVVVYTKFYDADKDDALVTVTKAESVTGTMTGFKVTSGTYRTVTLDGTTYSFNRRNSTLASATIGSTSTTTTLAADTHLNETFTAYLINGFVGYLVQESTSANKLAIVLDADGNLGSTFSTPRVQLLLADGTKTIVTLDDDSLIYAGKTGSAIANDGTIAINGSSDTSSAETIASTAYLKAGDLVRYSVNSDGTYTIIEVTTTASNGYALTEVTASGSVTAYDKDTKSVATNAAGVTGGSTVTDGSAVLFAKVGTEYKVYNIRNLNTVTVTNGAPINSVAKDGKVLAAYVVLTARPSSSGANSTVYGIVSSANGDVYVDGDTYKSFTVANDSNTYTLYMPSSSSKLAGGQLVSFTPASDNVYADADVEIYEGTTFSDSTIGLATWVKEYNAADQTLTYWGRIAKNGESDYSGDTGSEVTVALDDDVVIAYVNADDVDAGENIGISAFDPTTGYRNVVLVKDSSTNKVVAILVESSREADIVGVSLSVEKNTASSTAAWSTATDDTAVYAITTSGVALTATPTITWYGNDSTYTTSTTAPANLATVTLNALVNGAGTLTLAESGSTVAAGTYYFTITVTSLAGDTLTYQGSLVVAA
jgi:hypothetical protein